MIRVTRPARDQADDLLRFYVNKGRPDAAARLLADLAAAWDEIAADPLGGLPAPRPYPALSSLGFHWILVRIYWVAWQPCDDDAVVTNVSHVAADIEGRVATGLDGISDW